MHFDHVNKDNLLTFSMRIGFVALLLMMSPEICSWHGPAQGRLNNYKDKPGATRGVGAWCANITDGEPNRYLQVMKRLTVCMVTCLTKSK